MKKRRFGKRLLTGTLCIGMVTSMLTTTAMAAPYDDLTIAGVAAAVHQNEANQENHLVAPLASASILASAALEVQAEAVTAGVSADAVSAALPVEGSNLGGIRGKTEFELDRFDLQYIAGFDLVHSGNYSFMERQIPKIQNLGVPVSFDFSDCSTESYKKEMCAVVDYAFLSCGGRSLKEAEEETRALVSYGAKLAVATRGSEPCVAYDGKSFYYQEPKKIENVRDTMGAGDSFITAFLVHYISDKKAGQANVGKALDMASQFAAQICLLEGAFGYGKKYQ